MSNMINAIITIKIITYFSFMSSLEAAINELNDEGTSEIQKTKSLLMILETLRPWVPDQEDPSLEVARKG